MKNKIIYFNKEINAILIIIILFLFLICFGFSNSGSTQYYPNNTVTDQGGTTGRSVKNLVDAIGSSKNATIVLKHSSNSNTTSYLFETNETIPSNITLEIEPGAYIDGNVTINGPFKAELTKCFDPNSNIVFGDNGPNKVYLEWWGADPNASGDINVAAWNAALACIDASNGGTIIFSKLYPFGSNTMKVDGCDTDTLTIRGINFTYDHINLDRRGACGISSNASVCMRFGEDTDFTGRGFLQNFTVKATDANQVGIWFDNQNTGINCYCDMENVSVIDTSGPGGIGIDADEACGTAWRNIKIYGEDQCGIGIKVQKDCPTLISPNIYYCTDSIYLTTSSSMVRVHGGYILFCFNSHVRFAEGINFLTPSSFLGTFLGENSTTTPTVITVDGAATSTVYLNLIGCQFNSQTYDPNNTDPIIDFYCGGSLNMIGCINYYTALNTDIRLSQYSTLNIIGCKNFSLYDSIGRSIFALGKNSLSDVATNLAVRPSPLQPSITMNNFSYFDDGTQGRTGFPTFRIYQATGNQWIDISYPIRGMWFADATASDQGDPNTQNTVRYIKETGFGTSKKGQIILQNSSYTGETEYTFNTNMTMHQNHTLIIEPGAYIDGNATLTINGPFNGWDGCFDPNFTVIFGAKPIAEIFNYGPDTASDDDYLVTISSPYNGYIEGMHFYFDANNPNTGACTVNFNSWGAKSIKILHDQDPGNNCIEDGSIIDLMYDGTNFQMMNPCAN